MIRAEPKRVLRPSSTMFYITSHTTSSVLNPKIFISYSSKDKRIAGDLAKAAKTLNMRPFLAHDDICPGEKWDEVIRKKMSACDVVMVLITPNFSKAIYAIQETGAAWMLKKKVLPVCVRSQTPPGFIASIQGMAYDGHNPHNVAINALKLALSNTCSKKRMMDHLFSVLEMALATCKSAPMLELLLDAAKNAGLTAKQCQMLEYSSRHKISYAGGGAYMTAKELAGTVRRSRPDGQEVAPRRTHSVHNCKTQTRYV